MARERLLIWEGNEEASARVGKEGRAAAAAAAAVLVVATAAAELDSCEQRTCSHR